MKPLALAALAPAAALAFALGLAPVRPAPADEPAKPASRTFEFTYSVKVPAPAAGTKRLDVWIPLPLEDDLQTVTDLKVVAKQGDQPVKAEQTKDDEYGNRFAHVGLDDPKGDLSLSWTATVTRAADSGQGTGPMHPRFTEPDVLVPLDGKAAQLSKEVLGDKPPEAVSDRAKRIYDNVLATMVYDKQAPGWGKGDFNRACEVGKGNCTDIHAKFTGIARASGIPVRFTMGIPLSAEAKGTAAGYHCWAHFRDGDHWVPVDISEAQKVNAKDPAKAQWFFSHLDPDRLALTVGRDLTLAPKQQGAKLAFMAYPYAEADGKPVDLPKESRSFTWQNK